MSYKNELIIMIQRVPEKESIEEYRARILEKLKTLYLKALRESKKTGLSVESITYEILEGLEEALRQHKIEKKEIEQTLQLAAESITDLIHTCAREHIRESHRNLLLATRKLQDTIEAEKGYLLESMEAFMAYAKDHTHRQFEKSLSGITKRLNHLLDTVTEKIRGYTK